MIKNNTTPREKKMDVSFVEDKEPRVDKDMFQGQAVCVALTPDMFKLGEDRKSEVKDPEGPAEETTPRAVDGCPVGTISWK